MNAEVKYTPQASQRAQRRKQTIEQERLDADAWVDALVAEIPLDPDRFKDIDQAEQWAQRGLALLDREFKTRSQGWQRARARLADRTDAFNDQYGLEIPITPPPLRTSRNPATKTKRMFERGRIVHPVAMAFLSKLEDEDAMGTFHEQAMLPLVLFSEACFGGVVDDRVLFALAQHLQSSDAQIYWEPNRNKAWLEFSYATDKANNIFNTEGEPLCLRRWQPADESLPLLLKFFSHRDAYTKFGSTQSLMKQIREAISKFTGSGLPGAMTLPQFCDGAAYVFEEHADVSQCLLDCARGKTDWVSCPAPYFIPYIGGDYAVPEKIEPITVGSQRFDEAKSRQNPNITREYNRIRRIVKKKKSSTSRSRDTKAILAELTELAESQVSMNLKLLCGWLMHVFARPSVESVGTLERYFDAIGLLWLVEFDGVDLRSLPADAFFEKYELAIESKSERSRDYRARRFDDFHRYLHIEHGLPHLPSELRHGYSGTKMVRARLISEPLFQTFLQTLQATDCSEEQKVHFPLIFTLCYRLGLRIGEACHLRFSDIEVTDFKADHTVAENAWIFIRSNKLGATKSKRPLQLLLYLMLKPDEFEYFKAWYNQERRLGAAANDPLFPGGSHLIWNTTDLSHLFSKLMYQITGLHYSPHDCRHTTANRLFFIVEGIPPLDGGCYSPEHTERLRAALFTIDEEARDKFYHLTSVFNHLDPGTTFNSYIHLIDWIIAEKRDAEEHSFSITALRTLFPEIKANYEKFTTKNSDRIQAETLRTILLSRHRAHVEIVKAPPVSAPEIGVFVEPTLQGPDKSNLNHRILFEYENGDEADTISLRHQVPLKYVETIIANGERLATFETRQHVPRLFSAARRATNSFPCSPTPLREIRDRKWARQAVQGFRRLYKSKPELIEWMLLHWANHSHASDTDIRFYSPNDLKRFVKGLRATGAVKDADIHVRLRPPSGGLKESVYKHWNVGPKVLRQSEPISNSRRFPLGIAYLYLQSKEREGNEAKRASQMPRWVFHMLAVPLDIGTRLLENAQHKEDSDIDNHGDSQTGRST